MPHQIYLTKARDESGVLLAPITLYAPDLDTAAATVRSALKMTEKQGLQVIPIRRMHEAIFGRDVEDGRGVVSHRNIQWSGDGSFQPIKLFGA